MRHHNSLFHQMLQFVPWNRFEQLVASHGADTRVRRLTTKSQLVALLYGQLSGAQSLRDIEVTLSSQATRLYHLGASAPHRSTLADANARRPARLFVELFDALLQRAHPGLRRHAREAIHLIDATCVPLHALARSWAPDKKRGGAGAKLHVDLDAGTGLPVHFDITPVRTNDITIAKATVAVPGETYVFDLGYYDFGWWRRLHDAGCRFVTRLKCHTRPSLVETRVVAAGGPIKTDRIVRLDGRLASNRASPLAGIDLREIEVEISTGKRLRIVTNDLETSAEAIADLYKTRWQIELFFKWVKQNLKIRRFLGTSENAVTIQIAVALIAYLIIRMAHAAQPAVGQVLAFTRLVRANLMHRRRLDRLDRPPEPIRTNPAQHELALC